MNYSLLLLSVIPSLALATNSFRAENSWLEFSKVTTKSVVGTFPNPPVYALTTWYNPACTTTYGSAAILLNTCLTNSAGLSESYNCSNNIVFLTQFSDNVCGNPLGAAHRVQTCTPNRIDIHGVSITAGVTINSCTGTSSTIVTNVPNVNIEHANTADNACTQVIQKAGFFNDFCYPAKNGSTPIGFQFQWPNAISYLHSNCTGTAHSSTLNTNCVANPASTNPIFNGEYSQFSSTVSFASPKTQLGSGVFFSLLVVFFRVFTN